MNERLAARGSRYRYLDVLRGFALLGILLVNVDVFGQPLSTMGRELAIDWRPLHDVVAAHGVLFFAQYKFITLFSLLFGVGIGILRERAEATGRSFASWMVRRLGVLFAIGILHAWLVWYGDILVYYAALGLVLCWAAGWSARALTWAGSACLASPLMLLAFMLLVTVAVPDLAREFAQPAIVEDDQGASAHAAVTGTAAEFLEALVQFDPAFETAVYRDASYLRATVQRTFAWLVALLGFGAYFGPRIAGLFLLGMAAVRARWFLSPAEHRPAFARLALVGLGAGVPLQGLGSFCAGSSDPASPLSVLGEMCVYLGSVGLAAGYAGLVGLLCSDRSGRPPAWTRPVEAVGRTALSNYLLQSVLCTSFFYGQGFGLGFFGRVDRASQLVVVVVVWALGLILSPLWLARFSSGPVEWLWRRLTYARSGDGARLQPLDSAPSEAPR